jgi:hypothetical protein
MWTQENRSMGTKRTRAEGFAFYKPIAAEPAGGDSAGLRQARDVVARHSNHPRCIVC